MTTAMAFIASALQIVLFVTATPTLSEQDKSAQLLQATQYLVQASEALSTVDAQSTSITRASEPAIIQSTQASTASTPPAGAAPMEDKSALIVTLYSKSPKDAVNGLPYGEYTYKVWVKDQIGNYVKVPVTMNGEEKTADTITTKELMDWHTFFTITPNKPGPLTLTFTDGTHTEEINLNVE